MALNVEKLVNLYKSKRMTQEELAEEAGISKQALSNMLKRGADPRLSTIQKIANVLGVPLSYLNDETDFTLEQMKNFEDEVKKRDEMIEDLRFTINAFRKTFDKFDK